MHNTRYNKANPHRTLIYMVNPWDAYENHSIKKISLSNKIDITHLEIKPKMPLLVKDICTNCLLSLATSIITWFNIRTCLSFKAYTTQCIVISHERSIKWIECESPIVEKTLNHEPPIIKREKYTQLYITMTITNLRTYPILSNPISQSCSQIFCKIVKSLQHSSTLF